MTERAEVDEEGGDDTQSSWRGSRRDHMCRGVLREAGALVWRIEVEGIERFSPWAYAEGRNEAQILAR